MSSTTNFLILSPQSPAHTEQVQVGPSAPSSPTTDEPTNFLILSPHHRRSSVSSVASVSTVSTDAAATTKREPQFLGLVPECGARVWKRGEPEIVPDTECVSVMRPFREGFLRLG